MSDFRSKGLSIQELSVFKVNPEGLCKESKLTFVERGVDERTGDGADSKSEPTTDKVTTATSTRDRNMWIFPVKAF